MVSNWSFGHMKQNLKFCTNHKHVLTSWALHRYSEHLSWPRRISRIPRSSIQAGRCSWRYEFELQLAEKYTVMIKSIRPLSQILRAAERRRRRRRGSRTGNADPRPAGKMRGNYCGMVLCSWLCRRDIYFHLRTKCVNNGVNIFLI